MISSTSRRRQRGRASRCGSTPTPLPTSACRGRGAGRSSSRSRRAISPTPPFPYYTFREDVEIAGIPVFMTRLGYTAELGYELWVERDRSLELWDALVEAGTPNGMKVIGMVALDLFRIEGGFIIGGVEYDPTVSPFECGLGWSVAFDKGDFQGTRRLRAGPRRDDPASDERRARVRRGRRDRRATFGRRPRDRARHAVGRVPLPGWEDARPREGPQGRARARHEGHAQASGVEEVDGEIVHHPVYDPERKRAKES